MIIDINMKLRSLTQVREFRFWGIGGIDGTNFDIEVLDVGILISTSDVSWVSTVSGAGSSDYTWLRLISSSWEGSVEPEHLRGEVIPDAHGQSHASAESLSHLFKCTLVLEVINSLVDALWCGAESVCDWAEALKSTSLRVRVLNDSSILDV